MNGFIKRRDFSLLACAAMLGPAARAQQPARTPWRLATGYSEKSFHTTNIVAMAGEVKAATQGRLEIEVHANNALAKLNEVRAAVESGRVEAGETILSSMVGEIPIAGADSVPFIVGSFADARRMWRVQRPVLEREFAKRGLQVLYAVPWPPQGLYTARPVSGAQDFKGARMRTYNATTTRIASLLGAQGVDVPMVDVGRALAEGRIDSMITSAVTGVENKVWAYIKHYYEINAWFPKNVVFASSKAMAALAPDERAALLRAAAAAEARGWAASEAVAGDSVEELRRHGIAIERVPPDFAVNLRRLGERFSLEWIRQVGPQANEIFVPYFAQA